MTDGVLRGALRLGSMFSGVGGLDLAIADALNTRTVFVADVCKFDKHGRPGHYEPHRAPCSVLAHRFPEAPNLGDVSLIDWSNWRGRVDVLCAGFPCQACGNGVVPQQGSAAVRRLRVMALAEAAV